MFSEFETIIKVRDDNTKRFEKFVDKMGKLTAKLNMPHFEAKPLYDIVFAKKVYQSSTSYIYDGQYLKPLNEFKIIETRQIIYHIKGCQPVIEGWQMIAKLDFIKDSDVPLVMTVPNQTCPDQFFSANSRLCEHCHTKRVRSKAYILRNVETGEYKQVGSSCLGDFIRGDVNEMLEYFAQFWSIDFEGSKDEEDYCRRAKQFWTKDILISGMRLIKEFGFFPSKHDQSTLATLMNIINEPKHDMYKKLTEHPSEDELQELELILKEGQDLIPGDNSFLHNVKLLCAQQYWDPRYISFMVAWIGSYYKTKLQAVMEPKVETKPSEYVGKIGQRNQYSVVVKMTKVFESQWGYSTLHVCNDADHNVIVFYHKKALANDPDTSINIIGTVKDLREFNNVKQTVLNRVKIQ